MSPNHNYFHHLITKKEWKSQAERDWALSLKVAGSLTFDFNVEL